MNNKTVFYILIVFFGVFSFLTGFKYLKSSSEKTPIRSFTAKLFAEPVIGLFELNNKSADIDVDNFQHLALYLSENTSNETIKQNLNNLSSNKSSLLTINTIDSQEGNVLQRFVNGNFDDKIKYICNSLTEAKQPVYLRWNPEMEVPVTLYPWQYQSSALYTEAFRRFSKLVKQFSPNAKIVWGAAGYPGAEEYWPGNDVVDLISVTLDSKSELKAKEYPRIKNIAVSLKRKIYRMRFIDKPILILGTADSNTNALARKSLPAVSNELKREQLIIYSTTKSESFFSTPVASSRTAKPIIGAFDPKQLLLTAKPIKVEHLFIDLGNIHNGYLLSEFTAMTARKHDVILTVEPWRDKNYTKKDDVLLNTYTGKYDTTFKALYSIIGNTKQTVYLRFAHEMEIPTERYPWQSQDPVAYIKAFRHFMQLIPDSLHNIKKVWGPAGDRGSIEWWPGTDVVDYVSIAIYGLPDKNIADPRKQEAFSTIYARKHHRMHFAHKPIFITEFGVKGPEDLQMAWLNEAADVINEHKEIAGACYFNIADNPKVWGKIPAPDWSIDKGTFISFTEKLAP